MSLKASNNNLLNNLNLYIKYDSKIAEMNNVLKQLKQKKQDLQNNILYEIEDNDLTNKILKINDYKFTYNSNYTLAPLSLSLLEETLDDIDE